MRRCKDDDKWSRIKRNWKPCQYIAGIEIPKCYFIQIAWFIKRNIKKWDKFSNLYFYILWLTIDFKQRLVCFRAFCYFAFFFSLKVLCILNKITLLMSMEEAWKCRITTELNTHKLLLVEQQTRWEENLVC